MLKCEGNYCCIKEHDCPPVVFCLQSSSAIVELCLFDSIPCAVIDYAGLFIR